MGRRSGRRVFQLVSVRLHIVEGVFGASDDIIDAPESGVEVERRIARGYQGCRAPAEIGRDL